MALSLEECTGRLSTLEFNYDRDPGVDPLGAAVAPVLVVQPHIDVELTCKQLTRASGLDLLIGLQLERLHNGSLSLNK